MVLFHPYQTQSIINRELVQLYQDNDDEKSLSKNFNQTYRCLLPILGIAVIDKTNVPKKYTIDSDRIVQ